MLSCRSGSAKMWKHRFLPSFSKMADLSVLMVKASYPAPQAEQAMWMQLFGSGPELSAKINEILKSNNKNMNFIIVLYL